MSKIQFTKIELVCEHCGEKPKEFQIYKGMLYCDWCVKDFKKREQRKKDDAEWERAVSPKNNE